MLYGKFEEEFQIFPDKTWQMTLQKALVLEGFTLESSFPFIKSREFNNKKTTKKNFIFYRGYLKFIIQFLII